MDKESTKGSQADLEAVRLFWEKEPCGTQHGEDPANRKHYYDSIEKARYSREPFIPPFAEFDKAHGLKVLEVGVGVGTDFLQWLRAGAIATGIDLTETSVKLVSERLELEGFRNGKHYNLLRGNAEHLPFGDSEFDMVYSWGVMHHTTDTRKAVNEAFRVLKPGGTIKIMIYHPFCWIAIVLWIRHALLKGRPFTGLRRIVFDHVESPGTKTFTAREARDMFKATGFTDITTGRSLSTGDLLMNELGPGHGKPGRLFLSALMAIYPRWLVRLIGPSLGLNLMIKARKPADDGRLAPGKPTRSA